MGDHKEGARKAWVTIRKCQELALEAAKAGLSRPTELVNGRAITDRQWEEACRKAKSQSAPATTEVSIKINAFQKARASEAASKEALKAHCESNGWRIAFFEGKTGAPRTGIIDAVAFRLKRKNADALEIRLIQLKGGDAGISGPEIARLKKAVTEAQITGMLAAFDGEVLHAIPLE